MNIIMNITTTAMKRSAAAAMTTIITIMERSVGAATTITMGMIMGTATGILSGRCMRYLPVQLSRHIFPFSVEVLGIFQSFCFAPFSIVYLNPLETPIFTRKSFALSGHFFIEKFFKVCYNNSTL